MGALIFFIYRHLSLESQLVDYWWKINFSDIELVDVRRKNAGEGAGGSSVGAAGGASGSHVSSLARRVVGQEMSAGGSNGHKTTGGGGAASEFAKTTITKATNTSGFNSSAADVCYGEISLGVYKLSKVALKPIVKFRQSRKLMIELRTVSSHFAV